MVKSMTGYGRAREMRSGRDITVEVRSVNNRYLDCTVKLPRSLSFGEDAVKQAAKELGLSKNAVYEIALKDSEKE